MRAIKFRAWDGHLNQMEIDIHLRDSCNEVLARDRYIVEQYAGLKDKNGVEIYEGDIVRDVSHSDLVFVVEWDAQDAGYYMPADFDDEYKFSMSTAELEVVGNIHEHPELLEAK